MLAATNLRLDSIYPPSLLLLPLSPLPPALPHPPPTASGVLFAVISGGFGFGVGLSSFLPPGLRARYALSTCCLAASMFLAMILVPESLPASSRLPFRPRSANPLSCVRLFRSGRRMRVLAVLTLLHSAPMFMGDTLQVCLPHISVVHGAQSLPQPKQRSNRNPP
jgi:hypothetical protein